MSGAREMLSAAWDSLAGRVVLLGLSVGWVPFVLLSMAAEALRS